MPSLHDLVSELSIANIEIVVPLDYMTPTNIPINQVDVAMAKIDSASREFEDLYRMTFGGSIMGISRPLILNNTTGMIIGSPKVYKVGRTYLLKKLGIKGADMVGA